MNKIQNLEIEIEDLEFALLDAKEALHKSRPQYQEDFLKKEGRYPVGDIPRADLEKRIQLLEGKLQRKQNELKNLQAAQLPKDKKRFGYGELKQEIERLAKRDGFTTGMSVNGKTRKKWLQEILANGKTTTDAAIRAILSDFTITKEKKQK